MLSEYPPYVTLPVCSSGKLYVNTGFAQNCSSPALHSGHVRSESTMQPTAARSPGLNFFTADPTYVTRPTISWPGTHGYTVGMTPLHSLRAWCTSEWQIPQNRISICTAVSFGSRLSLVVAANGDVAPGAANAFALYIELSYSSNIRHQVCASVNRALINVWFHRIE